MIRRINEQDVSNAANDISSSGEQPSIIAIHKYLGKGSYSTISNYLKKWRESASQLETLPPKVILPEQLGNDADLFVKKLWHIAQEQAEAMITSERIALEEAKATMQNEMQEAINLADQHSERIEQLEQELEIEQGNMQKATGEFTHKLSESEKALAEQSIALSYEQKQNVELRQQNSDLREQNNKLQGDLIEIAKSKDKIISKPEVDQPDLFGIADQEPSFDINLEHFFENDTNDLCVAAQSQNTAEFHRIVEKHSKRLKLADLRQLATGLKCNIEDDSTKKQCCEAIKGSLLKYLQPDPYGVFNLTQFVDQVKTAAETCKTGWFGDDKVFISHVYEKMVNDRTIVLTLEQFKQHLAKANNQRLLSLAQADLIPVMNQEDVQNSEMRYLTSVFHFIRSKKVIS